MDDHQPVQKSGSRLGYKTLKRKIYEGVIQPLVYSRNTPHYDAFGVAAGLIVGLGYSFRKPHAVSGFDEARSPV